MATLFFKFQNRYTLGAWLVLSGIGRDTTWNGQGGQDGVKCFRVNATKEPSSDFRFTIKIRGRDTTQDFPG